MGYKVANYGNDSSSSLNGADQVRLKPSNFLGSADINGAFHTLIEITANSTDEGRSVLSFIEDAVNEGKITREDADKVKAIMRKIEVTYTKDKVITIKDFGRGIPLWFNTKPKEWKYNWHLFFSRLFASGKYDDELSSEGKSNYKHSLGTNGLGTTLTQYSSEFLNVISKRDGKIYRAEFYKGLALAHHYQNGELYKVIFNVEFPELYYVDAKVKAFNEAGELVTISLKDFNPYEEDLYQIEREEAYKAGVHQLDNTMYKVRDEEGYIVMENGNPIERKGLYYELYHSVLTVEKDTDTLQITGTDITWRIDNDVFPDTSFTLQMFTELLETQAHVNGMHIDFKSEYHNFEKVYEGTSAIEFFRHNQGVDNIESELEKEIQYNGFEEGKPHSFEASLTVAFLKIDSSIPSKHLLLQNTSLMTSTNGAHFKGILEGTAKFFDTIASAHKVKLKPAYYLDRISFMVDAYANVNALSFENQTKKGVTNNYVKNYIKNTVIELLTYQYQIGNVVLRGIVERAIRLADFANREEQVKGTVKEVKNIKKEKEDISDVYSPCTTDNKKIRRLIIVEGKSAMGAAKAARNHKYESIYAIQGKLPNALKTPLEDLLQNRIVRNLINIIGVGIDIGGADARTYNYSKRNYEVIQIMTDADHDGKQIRMLLFLVIYRLMRDLVEKGHVETLETPILGYEISRDKVTQNKVRQYLGVNDETEVFEHAYIYDLKDTAAVSKEYKDLGITLGKLYRFKGLGSFLAHQLHTAAFIPETQKTVSLQMDTEDKLVREVIDVLFGKDIGKNRREIILNALGVRLQDTEVEEFLVKESELTEVVEVM